VVMRINKSDNDHNRVTGTISKSYLKISEQHGWKAEHHRTIENSHTGYHAHILWEVLVYSTICLSWEITLHVPYTATTEQLQHYML
jgi:hypothetical protein